MKFQLNKVKQMEITEKVNIELAYLDNHSVAVNFDVYDIEQDETTKNGGYVHVRKDDGEQKFIIVVFNAEGDVVNETHLPYAFKGVDE